MRISYSVVRFPFFNSIQKNT